MKERTSKKGGIIGVVVAAIAALVIAGIALLSTGSFGHISKPSTGNWTSYTSAPSGGGGTH